jgi:hypothetical protein
MYLFETPAQVDMLIPFILLIYRTFGKHESLRGCIKNYWLVFSGICFLSARAIDLIGTGVFNDIV